MKYAIISYTLFKEVALMKERTELIAEALAKAKNAMPREAWYVGHVWERGKMVRTYMVASFSHGHQYYQEVREVGCGIGYSYSQDETDANVGCIRCTCPLYDQGHKPCKHAALVHLKLSEEARAAHDFSERAERAIAEAERQARSKEESGLERIFSAQGL
jgi:hypothetical protein